MLGANLGLLFIRRSFRDDINTLKQELSGTKAYKEISEEEKSVVNGHCNHLALKFSVCVKERQDRLPSMYWLPKLHKKKKKKKKKNV